MRPAAGEEGRAENELGRRKLPSRSRGAPRPGSAAPRGGARRGAPPARASLPRRGPPRDHRRRVRPAHARARGARGEYPELAAPDSPTRRVGGAPAEGFATVDALPADAVAGERVLLGGGGGLARARDAGRSAASPRGFVVELKIDGLSISLRYEGGGLVGARRGATASAARTSPRTSARSARSRCRIAETAPLEVRGEVYYSKRAFEQRQRRARGGGAAALRESAQRRGGHAAAAGLADHRPAAAGRVALRGRAGDADAGEPVGGARAARRRSASRCIPTGAAARPSRRSASSSRSGGRSATSSRSRPTASSSRWTRGRSRRTWARPRSRRAGRSRTSTRPRRPTTVVRDIGVQVGRTGTLTPVAHFDPVQLAGTTVKRATLHNYEDLSRKDVRVGDTVVVEKGGDVIPKVVRVLLEKRPDGAPPFAMPSHCPVCGDPVSARRARSRRAASTRPARPSCARRCGTSAAGAP